MRSSWWILPAVVLAMLFAPCAATAQVPSIASNGSLGPLSLSDPFYTITFNTDQMTIDVYTSAGGYTIGGWCPAGTYTGPGDPDGCARLVSQPNGPDIVVWDFTTVYVATGFFIRGSRPGAIAATGTITVSGGITVENGFVGAPSPVTCPGGGTGCGAGVAGSGPGGGGGGAGPGYYVEVWQNGYRVLDPLAGGGGAGGGAFGAGGNGGDSRTLIDTNGTSHMLPGGAGGLGYLSGLGPLVGGSGGGSGGDRTMQGGSQTYGGAPGGAGGGAAIFATSGDMVVSGVISAAGKPGAPSNDGGGGGGGGGGFLVFQVAGMLTIEEAGAISAAGGSGGVGPGNQTAHSYGGRGAGGIVVIQAGTLDNQGAIDVGGEHAGAVMFTLTIAAAGTGSGTVTSEPAGIDCTASAGSVAGTCVAPFAAVTLTATAAPGSSFVGWSGDPRCGDTVITLPGPVSCTAEFALAPPVRYPLATSVAPPGTGSISVNPPSQDGYYDAGTVVTLTAVAAPGYAFANWTGDLTGSVNPQTMTMSAARSVTANFSALPPPDFALGASPQRGNTAATVRAGSTATYRLAASPVNGFTGTIDLSCSGAPALAACTAVGGQVTVSGTSPTSFKVTVTTTAPSRGKKPTPGTPPGAYTLTLTGTSGDTLVHTLDLSLTVK